MKNFTKIEHPLLFLRSRQLIRDFSHHQSHSLIWKSGFLKTQVNLSSGEELIVGPELEVTFNPKNNSLSFCHGSIDNLIEVYKNLQDQKTIKILLCLL